MSMSDWPPVDAYNTSSGNMRAKILLEHPYIDVPQALIRVKKPI